MVTQYRVYSVSTCYVRCRLPYFALELNHSVWAGRVANTRAKHHYVSGAHITRRNGKPLELFILILSRKSWA